MTSRFCTNYSVLSRLLSFNSTTAQSAAAASTLASQPDLSSPTPSDRPMIPPLDIESGENSTLDDDPQNNEEPPDWKRTGKVVMTVGLGGVGVSVTLIVNAPPSAETHRELYTAYLSLVGLGLFSGIGLSFFSILMKGRAWVGAVQKNLIFFTLFFVAIACFLRLYLALPLAEAEIGTASVLVGGTAMVIYLICVGRWFNLRRLREA